jgi:hypothetical protein
MTRFGRSRKLFKSTACLAVSDLDQLHAVPEIQQVDLVGELRTHHEDLESAVKMFAFGGVFSGERNRKAAHQNIRPAARRSRTTLRTGALDQIDGSGAECFGFREWHIVREAAIDVRPTA